MSDGMNLVLLMGNLGADPELVQAASGPILKLRLATTHTYFDKDKGSYFFNHLTAAWRGDYVGEDELTLDSVFASVRSRTKKDVYDMSGGVKDQFPEVRRRYDGSWGITKAVKAKPKRVEVEEPKSKPKPVEVKDEDSKPKPANVENSRSFAPEFVGSKPGEERDFEIAKGVRMTFCWVPAGKAPLGSPAGEKDRGYDEEKHEFSTKGFWLGKYEVQQSEWEGVMGDNPSNFKGANLPVECVSWEDCQKFIEKCGMTGLKVKLPHEDEWEYACRGGMGNWRAFYWGDVLNGDKANHDGNFPYGTTTKGEYKNQTTPVGTYKDKAPHPWGLCDMSGNVWEWCENLYTIKGSGRVIRGGSWFDNAKDCRSALRYGRGPAGRFNFIGFRLALVP